MKAEKVHILDVKKYSRTYVQKIWKITEHGT